MKKALASAWMAGLLGALAAPAAADVGTRLDREISAVGDGTDSITATALTTTAITTIPITTINWWVYLLPPTWQCKKGHDGTPCTRADLANPTYRQIVMFSSGYTDAEGWDFYTDFASFVDRMSNAGNTWSTVKKDKLLYVGYFTAGGALNTEQATFHGAVLPHPIRDFALSASNSEVIAKVNTVKATTLPELKPLGVMLILNSFQSGITANAAPPNFLFANVNYGVAKMNREDLKNGYIGTHELGHAALNFLDEYVEDGLENLNIKSFDVATPLVLLNGTWGGWWAAIGDLFNVYDYNISEILAGNGNHNITLSANPSTVYSPISAKQSYREEGGFFFGRGSFHAAGNNLMNSNSVMRDDQDGFAYDHSGAQWMLINTAFGDAAYRANDRLRNAGPVDGWPLVFGSTTTVMMYDGDKRNAFHKTTQYVVQVGWWSRHWQTCWQWGFIPYPCYYDTWETAQKTISPTNNSIDLQASSLYGLANLAQSVLCGVGVTEIPKPDGNPFKLCEQPLSSVATAFLPTFNFYTPYQSTSVPADQWFTKYWWRFATHNGTTYSGWTGWSEFYRSF